MIKRKLFSLRTYFLLASVVLFIFLLLSNVVVKELFISPQLEKLEKEIHENNLEIISLEFEQQAETLENYVLDYALWDDSVDFIHDINTEDYISSTLIENTFENFDMDIIHYYTSENTLFWGKELNNGTLVNSTLNLTSTLLSKETLFREEYSNYAIIDTHKGFLLYGIALIGPSDGEIIEDNGVIIFGIFIDEEFEKSLEKTLVLPIKIMNGTTNSLSEEHLENSIRYILPIFTTNEKSLFIQTELEKKVSSSNYIENDIIVLFFLFFLFLFLFYLFIERKIIKPLTNLSHELHRKGNKEFSNKKSYVKEIFFLQKSFRDLIEKLVTKNLQLKEESYVDSLTQLYNKRFLEKTCKKLKKDQRLEGKTYGLLLIDIDFYKAYNDYYGHEKGDEILRKLGIEFKKCIRKNTDDYVFRFGGEEFIFIFTQISQKGLDTVIKKIQKKVKELKIEHKKSSVSNYLTLSGGYCLETYEKDKEILKNFKKLDDTLYLAKKQGRNKIMFMKKSKKGAI
jgi:diguanylate cyclase (GGDEF)-like protein